MNAYDTMLKALRDTLATMDANGVKLPATRIAIKHAIAKGRIPARISSTHPTTDMTTYTASQVEEMIKIEHGNDLSDSYLAGYLLARMAHVMSIMADETKTDAEKMSLLKIISFP